MSEPANADPLATTLTHAGMMVGTPAYMAPEQHLGEPADARSDQFAFAVALFEGVTGELPFGGEDLRTLSLAIVRGRLAPVAATLPPALRAVLSRALSVDIATRYESIEAMLDALQATTKANDVRFDTRQVDAVLDRAAQLAAADSGRPGLSPAEVEAIAIEAGIEPTHARQAAAEALAVPRLDDSATLMPKAASPSTQRGAPSGPPGFSEPVQVVKTIVRRPSPELMQLMVRELDRRYGRGKAEQLGASTTWLGGALEATIDLTTTGSRVVLRQRASIKTMLRPWALGVLGALLAVAIIVTVLLDGFGLDDATVVPLVFGCLGGGGFAGVQVARALHARELQRRHKELEYVAERLAALVESNSRATANPG